MEPKLNSGSALFISDCEGQIDAVDRLIERVPEDTLLVYLGDVIDRGIYAAELLDRIIKSKRRSIHFLGNHEHIMLDKYFNKGHRHYDDGYWEWPVVGGSWTKSSYLRFHGKEEPPQEHLEYLNSLPYCMFDKGLFVSHAPLMDATWLPNLVSRNVNALPKFGPDAPLALFWNRDMPQPIPGVLQIAGHNSRWGLVIHYNPDGSPWYIGLDQTKSERVTGYYWREGKKFDESDILWEPYLVSQGRQV